MLNTQQKATLSLLMQAITLEITAGKEVSDMPIKTLGWALLKLNELDTENEALAAALDKATTI